MTATTEVHLREVERFLYHEARCADEHDYRAWEALWTDDARYWVPAARDDDPDVHMSIVHDNRRRIATRVAQLETGRRYSQAPPSRLRRTVSNIEVLGPVGGEGSDRDDLVVAANFVLLEARESGTTTWGGRVTYHLRGVDEGLMLAYKKVDLVDRPWVLPNLSFLI